MDKKKVESELSSNRLCFINKGIDAIPSPLTYVGSYPIGGPDNEDLDACVYAYTEKRKDNGRVFCCSFMVRIGDSFDYYYRDSLYEIEDLVKALRIRHGHKGSAG